MNELKDRTVLALRSVERFTKTDMVYLAQGGFWTILAQKGKRAAVPRQRPSSKEGLASAQNPLTSAHVRGRR